MVIVKSSAFDEFIKNLKDWLKFYLKFKVRSMLPENLEGKTIIKKVYINRIVAPVFKWAHPFLFPEPYNDSGAFTLALEIRVKNDGEIELIRIPYVYNSWLGLGFYQPVAKNLIEYAAKRKFKEIDWMLRQYLDVIKYILDEGVEVTEDELI